MPDYVLNREIAARAFATWHRFWVANPESYETPENVAAQEPEDFGAQAADAFIEIYGEIVDRLPRAEGVLR